MKKTDQTQESSFSSSEHQFQPREDDDEILWDVIDIIDEKKGQYLVNWAGIDPETRKPWDPSWVPKGDVTNDLVARWKMHKKEQGSATARRKKSGKRTSILSTTGTGETSRPVSTRRSVSTTKSTPTRVSGAGPSSRRTVQPSRATAIQEEGSSGDEEPLPAKMVLSRSANGAKNGRLPKENEKYKRKRESSVASTSSVTSLPKIVMVHTPSLSTPPVRPRKKRKLEFTPSNAEDSEKEAPRVKGNGGSVATASKDIEVIALEEEDDDEPFARHVAPRKTQSMSHVEQEPESSRRVNGLTERGKKTAPHTVSPKSNVLKKRPKSPPPIRHIVARPTLTKRTGKDSLPRKTASGELPRPPLSSKSPQSPQTEKRTHDKTKRELSPDTVQRLKQFDDELEALEAEQRKREAEEAEHRAKEAQVQEEDDDRISLEYCDEFPVPAAEFDHPPEPSSPPRSLAHPPLSNEIAQPPSPPKVHNAVPHRPPDPKTKVNSKTSNDSYRQGIVPETEPEDSGNTPSQDLSLTQSQAAPLVGSPPSMSVEPPASLRSPAPTPARPKIISKMRPRTPSSRSESLADLELPHILTLERIEEELQPPSQDADVSAPHDSIETDSQEYLKNQQVTAPAKDEVRKNGKAGAATSVPVPYLSGAGIATHLSVVNKHLSSTVEDIEEFTTPEKRTKDGIRLNGELRGKRPKSASPESDAIRNHGKELADAARRAKLQSRPQAPKKTLTDIVHDRQRTVRVTAAVHFSSLGHLPPSSIETPSSSVLVPDSDKGFPEIPEEVVREMERAYVNLDGGMNHRTDDDTLEDSGSSRPANRGQAVLAIRHEEEESTQDLLQEMEASDRHVEDSQELGVEAIPMDGVEMPQSPREQTVSLEDQVVSDMLQADNAEALPMTSSDRVDKLEALLRQERTRSQDLHEEITSLRQALELAKADANFDEQLGQRLKDAEVTHERDRATWSDQRASLVAAIEDATRAKESAYKEVDFVKEQYHRASGFVTTTREENKELQKRAKIAEDQAKSGVAMIKATYENKVKELERHMEKWQTMAAFLIQKDYRSDNDQLRRRAAEHPELKAKCHSLQGDINFLSAEISRLENDRDGMARELDYWKQEAERLSAELDNSRAETERFIQASASGEMVYRCLWRTQENKPCDEVVQTVEELRNHLYSAGHLRFD